MDFIFTDMIIHAKVSSVKVMSVIIMSDNEFCITALATFRSEIAQQSLQLF